MTELERRALMGDFKAQEWLTEDEILLPCPFCGDSVTIKKVNYGISGTLIKCDYCNVTLFQPDKNVFNINIINHKEACIGRWNTRTAPPVGKCRECKHWYKNHCATGVFATEETDANFYCSYFESKGGEENE